LIDVDLISLIIKSLNPLISVKLNKVSKISNMEENVFATLKKSFTDIENVL